MAIEPQMHSTHRTKEFGLKKHPLAPVPELNLTIDARDCHVTCV
jgi:hypothetical protein